MNQMLAENDTNRARKCEKNLYENVRKMYVKCTLQNKLRAKFVHNTGDNTEYAHRTYTHRMYTHFAHYVQISGLN